MRHTSPLSTHDNDYTYSQLKSIIIYIKQILQQRNKEEKKQWEVLLLSHSSLSPHYQSIISFRSLARYSRDTLKCSRDEESALFCTLIARMIRLSVLQVQEERLHSLGCSGL
jgi:hypothetical protein